MLDVDALVLDFEEEIALAENIAQPISVFTRLLVLLFYHRFRDHPTQAGGERDQALAVFCEKFVVNARFVIEAFEEARGNQLD